SDFLKLEPTPFPNWLEAMATHDDHKWTTLSKANGVDGYNRCWMDTFDRGWMLSTLDGCPQRWTDSLAMDAHNAWMDALEDGWMPLTPDGYPDDGWMSRCYVMATGPRNDGRMRM
ncbi:hypothetical protein BV22DRAFT_1052501, partial [Leucogyrophana mollusca]